MGALSLTINSFEQGGLQYGGSAAVLRNLTNTGTFSPAAAAVTLGYDEAIDYNLYLFANPGYATITAFTAGTFAAPIANTGAITVTFSEEMNPSATAAYPGYTGGFTQSWSGNTLTLTPNGRLPFNTSGATGATLTLGGLTVKSGANLFNSGATIRVFTPEALKLTAVDLNPAGTSIPARVATGANAVKLTFSKPLSSTSNVNTFSWGSTPAAWRFASATNTSEVFVYTDVLTTAGANITYSVVAAADLFDTASGNTNSLLGATIEKDVLSVLTLKGTSLWTLPATTAITATSTTYNVGTVAPSPAITITFDQAIPATASVSVSFTSDGSTVASTTTVAGNTVTVTPTGLLTGGTTYSLAVTVTLAGNTLFDGSRLSAYNGNTVNVSGNVIQFTAKPIP